MAHELRGRVWRLPDDIDTGEILPHATLADLSEVDPHRWLFGRVAPGLGERIAPGDMLWAGQNFGQGSSREDAARMLKDVGVRLVLAGSFARIFYRNAINIGLPVAVADPGETKDGDELVVNLVSGEIENRTRELKLRAKPLPPAIRTILAEGGLVQYIQRHGEFPVTGKGGLVDPKDP